MYFLFVFNHKALPPPPRIDPPLEDITARPEETVRMICKVDDEEAIYYWFKGDKQLSDGIKFSHY